MLARALIVLLLVLNLGVAAWWIARPAPSPVTETLPADLPRLQLLSEVPPRAQPAAAASTASPMVATTIPATGSRCASFGPFVDATELAAARATLQSQVAQLRVRETAASGRGWRVWLPPLPDRAAAQAMAARVSAAGFQDYYVMPDGGEANAIALGRFGNQAAAQRRQAALQAAGFPAQAEALGGAAQWIDVKAGASFDPDRARRDIGATQARPLDCARLQ